MSKIKLVVEVDESDYEAIKNDGVQNHIALSDEIIKKGTPITEGDMISKKRLKLFAIDHDYFNGVEHETIRVVPVVAIDNAPSIGGSQNE